MKGDSKVIENLN